MNNYVIETRNLTKQYETQKSVADLNIHVKKGRIYGLFLAGISRRMKEQYFPVLVA